MPTAREIINHPRFDELSVPEQEQLFRDAGIEVNEETRRLLQLRKGIGAPTPGQAAAADLAEKGAGILAKAGPPFAATFLPALVPQLRALQIAGRSALPLIQALAGPAAQALNPLDPEGAQAARESIGPSLGAGLAAALFPGGGPTWQALKQGAGAVGGLGVAHGLGLSAPTGSDYVLTGALPALTGLGVGTGAALIRQLARMTPGTEIALKEKAFQDVEDYVRTLRPAQSAESLYGQLAAQAQGKQVTASELSALVREEAKKAEALRQLNPALVRPRTLAVTGAGSALKAKDALPMARNTAERASLTARKSQKALIDYAQSPNPDPEKLSILQETARLDAERARILEDKVQGLEAIVDVLSNDQVTDFETLHQYLKYTSSLLKGEAPGEIEGIIKKVRAAIWEDLNQVAADKALLKQANMAAAREFALEDIDRYITESSSHQQGVLTVDMDKVADRVWKAFREDELFRRAFAGQQDDIMDALRKMAWATSGENRIGLTVFSSMLGGLAGRLVTGGSPTGTTIGAAVGVASPNVLTRIITASPRARKILVALTEAGRGRITQEALQLLVQMEEQNLSRSRIRESIRGPQAALLKDRNIEVEALPAR